ncbi:MAG: DsbA family protein, partial [Gammaproteobacteria bacterium]|nr:DsbA family protein [Gammaproteobacteria bacterium]
IAAKKQHPDFEALMTEGIQKAYYLNALNPSNEDTLINIAQDIGLNEDLFKKDLKSNEVNDLLLDQIHTTKTMPISGFPSLVLVKESNLERINIDYLNSNYIINQIIT